MDLSVFGLGYVGCVTAAGFAREGHEVIGVDLDRDKVGMINAGKSPIVEQGMDDLVRTVREAGRLRATEDAEVAVDQSHLCFVCVGTPSSGDGGLDDRYLTQVCEQIGSAMSRQKDPFTVVIRSTTVPGTVEGRLLPILEEASGKTCGRDFDLCANPEFLREGSSISDFFAPPKIVIGEREDSGGDLLAELHAPIEAPLFRTGIKTAEMVKYADNAFHSLKIAFANEVGNLCRRLGLDSHALMEIFCQDTKLNISSAYLKPGFAFGGSCLPKDLRALLRQAKTLDLSLPVLESILESNESQLDAALDIILSTGKMRVGLLGLSFKPGTDDLRESPLVHLAKRLHSKGLEVKTYDENVSVDRLLGANKAYAERQLPNLDGMLCKSIDELVRGSEVIVLGHKILAFKEVLRRITEEQTVVDLVRLYEPEECGALRGVYYGICW